MAAWQQYYYCSNCRRPCCESGVRTGEGVQVSENSYLPSRHCVSCDQSVHQPSSLAGQMITLSVVPIVMSCFWSEWPGNRTALLVIEILLGIAALLLAKSSLSSSQKCKDSWGMQHGTDSGCAARSWPKVENIPNIPPIQGNSVPLTTEAAPSTPTNEVIELYSNLAA